MPPASHTRTGAKVILELSDYNEFNTPDSDMIDYYNSRVLVLSPCVSSLICLFLEEKGFH